MKKRIIFECDEEIIKKIDMAAEKDCRNRSSFLIKSALEKAEELLKEKEE